MTSGLSDEAVRDGDYTTTCWECSAYCGALATVKNGTVVNYAPNPVSSDVEARTIGADASPSGLARVAGRPPATTRL